MRSSPRPGCRWPGRPPRRASASAGCSVVGDVVRSCPRCAGWPCAAPPGPRRRRARRRAGPAAVDHLGGGVVEGHRATRRRSPPTGARPQARRSSSATVRRPSPTTTGGRRTEAATTSPPMTRMRRSSPGTRCSSSTSGARRRAAVEGRGQLVVVGHPDGDAPPLLAPGRLHHQSPRLARKARSSPSKVARRPGGTAARPRQHLRGSAACGRSGRNATAVVSSESDSMVVTVRPPACRRSSPELGVEHLDGDPAAHRLVDDDPAVAVEVVVAG